MGETRTRTGDTTIFSRAITTVEPGGSAGNSEVSSASTRMVKVRRFRKFHATSGDEARLVSQSDSLPSGPVDPADFSPVVPFERSFDAQIGVDYDRIAPDEVVATFVVRAELLDSGGRVHGGVLTAVAEGTASMGTAAGVMNDGMAASGMSNDTTVVADVTEGRLTAVATRRAAAPDLWVWDVEITGDDGRTCSLSKVMIAVRPMR